VDVGEQPDAGEGEAKAGAVGSDAREEAAEGGHEPADADQAGAEAQADGDGELASEGSEENADEPAEES
jgi:hypothetical protein